MKFEWAIKGQKSLKITGSDGGRAEWISLTNLWYELEASTSFSTGKSLLSKGRPRAVAWWIQRARKGTPPIPDVGEFADQWRDWWRALNLNGAVAMEARCAGRTGLLMCLRWWKGELAGADDKGWKEAVADVTWVLQQLLADGGGGAAMDVVDGNDSGLASNTSDVNMGNTGFNSRNLVPSLITLSMFLAQVATFWHHAAFSLQDIWGATPQVAQASRVDLSLFSVDPCGTTLTTLMTDGTILRSWYHTTLVFLF
ncbi:hypothetical protein B0H13DRAFT_2465927 [Mycena leptocephala]|nr:hypothetical protein B0H13DRAFT_2465927 [Mycena leptocephala]